MDAVLLARIQFGFTISFHIIFPAITIGLASYLAVLEALWLATGRPVYMTLYQFWLRPFAVAFAMGVVSGIVLAYQFGTHWSGFSRFAGAITGPLLTYEVLTAFFLEAGFLGVMLFGLKRVGPGLHFVSTCVVALGTLVSATWILASNSWMQTPQGHEIVNGVVVPVDWLQVILNPSFPYRLSHMVVAAFVATALIVGGTGAWHLLKRHGNAPAGLAAILAGWSTTEIGRQPWVVYGLLRTSDAASPHPAGQVAFTLALFVLVYVAVFGAGTAYGMHLIAEDPAGAAAEPEGGAGQPSQPMRPLSAAQERDGHGH